MPASGNAQNQGPSWLTTPRSRPTHAVVLSSGRLFSKSSSESCPGVSDDGSGTSAAHPASSGLTGTLVEGWNSFRPHPSGSWGEVGSGFAVIAYTTSGS